MKRDLMENLIAWKKDTEHRPLLLRGARQVGKTWLMKEFGSREYNKTAYVRFDHASPIRDVFASETNIANRINLSNVWIDNEDGTYVGYIPITVDGYLS